MRPGTAFMISSIELLIILLVAIIVIPSGDWPKVLRAVMKLVRGIKRIVGQLEDRIEDIENEIIKDMPVDNLRKKTTEELISDFATPIHTRVKAASSVGSGKTKK